MPQTPVQTTPVNPQLQQQWDAAAAQLSDPSRGNIPAAFQRWKSLSQGDNFTFPDYAGFLMSYPGWPGEDRMRKNAEQAIELGYYPPAQLVAYFQRFEPVTNTGAAQYAIALANSGDPAQASAWARKAWVGGPLSDIAETTLMGMFAGQFTTADYDARIDALLWAGATNDAGALIAYASPQNRQLFLDRLAIKARSGDLSTALYRSDSASLSNPGYLTDRATYMRGNGQSFETRQLLANRPPLTAYPGDAEEWYETLLVNARAAENDSQNEVAYSIASRVDDAFPVGTDISAQPLGVRDDYTSLTWLAGQTAYYKLGRFSDAARMFRALRRRRPLSADHHQGSVLGRQGFRTCWRQRLGQPLLRAGCALFRSFLRAARAGKARPSDPEGDQGRRQTDRVRPAELAARVHGRAGCRSIWQLAGPVDLPAGHRQ